MQSTREQIRSREEIIAILISVRDEIERRFPGIKKIGLFGSYARGDQHETSDIDVLVEFHPGAGLFDLAGLQLYLEAVLEHSVDVVPERALREELIPAILADVRYV